jgi:hypothetical protein
LTSRSETKPNLQVNKMELRAIDGGG